MLLVDSALSGLMEIEGVLATLVLSVDGAVEESVNLGVDEVEYFASLCSLVASTTMALGNETKLGELRQFMLEFGGGKIYLQRSGERLIVVFASAQAVSGMIRLAMADALAQL